MEWLKKHWELIAAIAVGIPVLYWLYQTYQSDQAANATDAQTTDLQDQEQADEAAYAQSVAVGNLQGGSSSGSSTPGNAVSNVAPVINSNPVVQSDPAYTQPAGTTGFYSPTSTVASPILDELSSSDQASGLGGIDIGAYEQAIANSGNEPAVGSANTPSASPVSTLFGSGGSGNDTAPAPVYAGIVNTQSNDGTIPEHGTAIAKTPTPVELASIGGRGTR